MGFKKSTQFLEWQLKLRILLTFQRILALYSHVCMYVCLYVCLSSSVTFPFISTVWCFRPYKPDIFWKLIIWWWHWPRRRLTKRQIQRQRHTDKDKYKVLPRPYICYIFHKQGFQGFKILYMLSSCDDTDKDTILCIIRGEYFFGVNISQRWIYSRGEYFSGVKIFQGWTFLNSNLEFAQITLVLFYLFTKKVRVTSHKSQLC